MADDILYLVKKYLYERQEPDEGKLDGTLHLCNGSINSTVILHKSIFPTWLKIERHRGSRNRIYYKTYVNKDSYGIPIVLNKKSQEIHYFTNPIGAVNLITSILQSIPDQNFTILIEGENIANYVIYFSNENYQQVEARLYQQVHSILTHFSYIDFEHHQYYNKC
jgi:hypothetical protein